MNLIVAIIFVVCTVNYIREPNLIPTPPALDRGTTSTSFPGDALRSKPELEPDRKIQEVDCSKPVDLSAGNLRCK